MPGCHSVRLLQCQAAVVKGCCGAHVQMVQPVEAASLMKPEQEVPAAGSDTVYFCVVDG